MSEHPPASGPRPGSGSRRGRGTAPDAVVVTGIGVMLPRTSGVRDFWRNVSLGRSQIGPLTRFDAPGQGLAVHAAAQIDSFDADRLLPDLDARHAAKYSREILITMAAVVQARQDAALRDGDLDPSRLGVVMSSSRGPLAWWRPVLRGEDPDVLAERGAPMFAGLPGFPATLSAIHIGARGLVTTVSNACVGGHQAIGIALEELLSDRADAVLAGGHEFPIVPEVLHSYRAMGRGVISSEKRDPTHAVRPYNDDREGFALGEGAVVLCLERESTARRRGARVYARLLAHRYLNEAGHPTTMDLTGRLTAGLIRRTLADSGLRPEDVDYFCAHGTATRYNDLAESRALRALYPDRTPGRLPPISSNKPIYGHTFGLAGVINAAATSLMLHHQRLAPTINLTSPDPECDHDHVAEGPRDTEVRTAVSLSFAFGSQTSVLALETAA
ncbi:beta-ketoacyl-[acyl-carrier-protein] synthase family protein [Allostreptomyces psammosilenae]|uniref:3-oxoacyl-[acyl-carrier-protein] synthase II n=1 Tax=Allostreptomyces psammosilenae TaxID=1892865 RepID=A0A852ZQ15_9ACTN|nr:beta-ketoacyl-[acyl-carrier-protein] synthase family protein [Allostreptomyces psammosilenae]NYI04536.1 3-oxoacyl-[acyl-carrier-protein] synthase II [Allostreptomyces psammosilenae]